MQDLNIRRVGRQAKSAALSNQSPVGGLNLVDAEQALKPKDARILDNWIAQPGSIMTRPGYLRWQTSIGAAVETIMGYSSGANQVLFAAAGANIYDVTLTGVATPVVAGRTSARNIYTQYANTAGQWLYVVNGVDSPQLFNGTAWQAVTDVSAPISITGVTTSLFSYVTQHQNRLWFVERNSMRAWYLGTNAVGGAATMFDFGPLFEQGGKIVAMLNWTIDAGNNYDDRLVIITSNGEIAVYQGIDPSAASTWQLDGVYYGGSPVGTRPFYKIAGDVAIISQDGLFLLSSFLQSTRVQSTAALSYKITPAITMDASQFRTEFGWQVILYPGRNIALVNVPDNPPRQWVINTITKGWSSFSGWPAICWEWWNEELWFGTEDGHINIAFQTASDNGSNIRSTMLTSYNYANRRSNLKHWQGVRLSGVLALGATGFAAIIPDYQTQLIPVTVPLIPLTPGGSVTGDVGIWDVSLWDVALWGSGGAFPSIPLSFWTMLSTIGYSAATYLVTENRFGESTLTSIDYLVEYGGII